MAKFNEILTGRHNKMLTRLFSMKGPAPAPQLAGEIMPVHPFFSGVENRFLETWNRFMTFGNLGPTVGQTEAIQIRNPPGSNLIAVMEGIIISPIAADRYFFSSSHANVADLNNVGTGILLDPRAGGPGQVKSVSIISISSGGAGDLGFSLAGIRVGATTSFQVIQDPIQEMTVLPGDTLRIRQETANSGASVNFLWRERTLEESELRQ